MNDEVEDDKDEDLVMITRMMIKKEYLRTSC